MRLTLAPPPFPHAQASRMHLRSSCEKTEDREGKKKGASVHLFLPEFGYFSLPILFDVVQWSRLSQLFPKPERLTPMSVYLACPTGGCSSTLPTPNCPVVPKQTDFQPSITSARSDTEEALPASVDPHSQARLRAGCKQRVQ